MDTHEANCVVEEVITLVGQYYLDSAVAAKVTEALAAGVAEGRYQPDAEILAAAVTTDLQSVNGDKHLRLEYHVDELPQREHGDDTEQYAAMARWADQTSFGIARIERLAGNVGYLNIQPVLFPVAHCGDAMSWAMSLLASSDALIIDVRECVGGDPAMTAWLCSYLYGPEPMRLSSLCERGQTTQSWTLPFVPGRRFGATKPVYILTSATTFSGGEHLSYDLQQLGRATIVGEVTKGGAHAREGFRVHAHLEATIPVAEGLNPISGSNWEGVGVAPDVKVAAAEALERAHGLALEHVATHAEPRELATRRSR